MLSIDEYKVLSKIKNINDNASCKNSEEYEFTFRSKILSETDIEDYELNEILRSLDNKGYICNLFNKDTKYIYCTKILDSGKVALKNYKKDFAKHIFNKYIWVVFTIILTAILTGYFTSFFTK